MAMHSVTQFSRQLAGRNLRWASWPQRLPSAVYRFPGQRFHSCPEAAGEELHGAFSRFVKGCWVPKHCYSSCRAIIDALLDIGLDLESIQTETPVTASGLSGRPDIIGTTVSGNPFVGEIKTSLGRLGLAPRTPEIIQLATYAALLGHYDSVLACLRLAPQRPKLSRQL